MIIITGASGGIGNYLYQALGTSYDVIGTYNSNKLDGLEHLDTTDESSIEKFVDKHRAVLSDLTFIHCVGVTPNGVTHKYLEKDWDWAIESNLKSAFLVSKHLLPIMRAEEYGRIIFLSSVVPLIGVAGTPAYSASKAGLWGLAKTISAENISKGITCNCLTLGYMEGGIIGDIPEEVLLKIISNIPAKRLGAFHNVMSGVRFLMDSDYTTGASIEITGGF